MPALTRRRPARAAGLPEAARPQARPRLPAGPRRRRATTALEAVLVLALGLSLVTLGFRAFRFFSTRTATSADRSEKARRSAIFLERLRRVLRTAFRVVPTERGFVVLGPPRLEGGRALSDEWAFEQAGREGIDLRGPERTVRFPLDLDEPEAGLPIDVVGDTLRVRLGREGTSLPREVVLTPVGRSALELLTDREGAQRDLQAWAEGDGWTPPTRAEERGAARASATGAGAPVAGAEAAEVAPGSGTLRDGLDLEVAVAPIELREVGQALLPPRLPPGVPRSTLAEVEASLTAQGLDPARAAEVAVLIRIYEEAVAAGDRRGAGRTLAQVDGILRTDGVSGGDVVAILTDASRTAETLAEAAPGGVAGVIERAEAEDDDAPRVSETLIETDAPNLPPEASAIGVDDLGGAGGPGLVGGGPAAGTTLDPVDGTTGEDTPPVVTLGPGDQPGEPPPPVPDPGGGGAEPPRPGPGRTVVSIQDGSTTARIPDLAMSLLGTVPSGTIRVLRWSPDGTTEPAASWTRAGGQTTSFETPGAMGNGPGSELVIPVEPGQYLVVETSGIFQTVVDSAGFEGEMVIVD